MPTGDIEVAPEDELFPLSEDVVMSKSRFDKAQSCYRSHLQWRNMNESAGKPNVCKIRLFKTRYQIIRKQGGPEVARYVLVHKLNPLMCVFSGSVFFLR
jgi:hypothetical protein